MAKVEGLNTNLPVALNSGARHRFGRSLYTREAPKAGFLSQLIAEKHQLSIQREKRQAPVAEVLMTYDAMGRVAQRRLPPGTRTNLDA
ncbi:MAG TPA: hypothetical protein VG757_09555 [Devosia sp.]|nr:hypothetical protein [Devosia sp.]